MNFKKILAFLLAVMMVMSFAACGETGDDGDKDATTTVPQETEPQETEPQEETLLPEIETEETQPTVDAVYGGENEAQEENGEYVYTASFSGLVPGE